MAEPRRAPLWTAQEIVSSIGGRLAGMSFDVAGVSIDTRTLEPGDLFVALKGERDGHAFVRDAFKAGAAGVLASQPVDGPHIEVPDTFVGLQRMGIVGRERCGARRGAVTGSVGKTSVTQAVKAGLALAGPAHGSVKSYNNDIGVPLTLARMPRETARAVFEIGMNHAGEIEPLSKLVKPDAVAITTVGAVHTEAFADGEAGVARAKAEIFAGLKPGGAAVLNADDRWFDFLKGEAKAAGARVVSFGAGEGCDARLLGFQAGEGGAVVRAAIHGRPVEFPILQTGAHWGPNSLCVLLLLEALDVGLDLGVQALGAFEPLAGRGTERTVQGPAGAFVLIDESYNANPLSMRAALKSLGACRAEGRKIAVLTDMLELGADAARAHAELAAPIAEAGVDLVFCAGPLMRGLWDALPTGRKGAYADTAAKLAPDVTSAVRAGDAVMVKGSNGSKAGLIAQALGKLGDTALAEARGNA